MTPAHFSFDDYHSGNPSSALAFTSAMVVMDLDCVCTSHNGDGQTVIFPHAMACTLIGSSGLLLTFPMVG